MSPNEARAYDEQSPYEGGDEFWMMSNVQRVTMEEEPEEAEVPEVPEAPESPEEPDEVEVTEDAEATGGNNVNAD
jgi:hypothetical protein